MKPRSLALMYFLPSFIIILAGILPTNLAFLLLLIAILLSLGFSVVMANSLNHLRGKKVHTWILWFLLTLIGHSLAIIFLGFGGCMVVNSL